MEFFSFSFMCIVSCYIAIVLDRQITKYLTKTKREIIINKEREKVYQINKIKQKAIRNKALNFLEGDGK